MSINIACDELARRVGLTFPSGCRKISPLTREMCTVYVWSTDKRGILQLSKSEQLRVTAAVHAEILDALFGWYMDANDRPNFQPKYNIKDREKRCE